MDRPPHSARTATTTEWGADSTDGLVLLFPRAASASAEITVVRVPDLVTAQRERRRIQRGDPRSVVLLEVEAVVAQTFRQAREAAADAPQPASTVRYIGTSAGLGGLIADISATDLADGVLLTPLGTALTPDLVVEEALAWLMRHRVVLPAGESQSGVR